MREKKREKDLLISTRFNGRSVPRTIIHSQRVRFPICDTNSLLSSELPFFTFRTHVRGTRLRGPSLGASTHLRTAHLNRKLTVTKHIQLHFALKFRIELSVRVTFSFPSGESRNGLLPPNQNKLKKSTNDYGS